MTRRPKTELKKHHTKWQKFKKIQKLLLFLCMFMSSVPNFRQDQALGKNEK